MSDGTAAENETVAPEAGTAHGLQASTVSSPDPDGDVILLINGEYLNESKRFRVSSKVLGLASPYFRKLFDSGFKESKDFRDGTCSEIPLHEDDTEAMTVILDILHHQVADVPARMEPERLARLAIQCDKYQCSAVLKAWAALWSGPYVASKNGDEFPYILVAAHLFDLPFSRELLRRASVALGPHFRPEWNFLSPVGDYVPKDWLDEIENWAQIHLIRFQEEIQGVERLLRMDEDTFTTRNKRCFRCNRLHPSIANKCHLCNSTDLIAHLCTLEHRISTYFAILADYELWPTAGAFEHATPAVVINRIQAARMDRRHRCGGGMDCPLEGALRKLLERTVDATRIWEANL